MHFRSDEKFLELTKILEIKNKGNYLFRYSAGQNDTTPKYFWSLCSETRWCRWGLTLEFVVNVLGINYVDIDLSRSSRLSRKNCGFPLCKKRSQLVCESKNCHLRMCPAHQARLCFDCKASPNC